MQTFSETVTISGEQIHLNFTRVISSPFHKMFISFTIKNDPEEYYFEMRANEAGTWKVIDPAPAYALLLEETANRILKARLS